MSTFNTLCYGKHGFQTVGKDISAESYFAGLSEVDQQAALKLGQGLRELETNRKVALVQEAIEKAKIERAIQYKNAPVNQKIVSLVEKGYDYLTNQNKEDNITLGTVSNETAEEIKRLTKINVEGFKVVVEARQIAHILKRHGEDGKADSSMKDPSDIAKMEYVLENPDSISKAGKTNAYWSNVNGRNKTADTVLYEKSIGEKSYYVVQAVPDIKSRTLYVVSAFIGKPGYKKEASQLTDANIPSVTSKNDSVSASNSIIAQNSEIVKGKVFYDERINLEDLTEKQRDEIAFAGTVIAAIGNTVHFYNSQYAPKDSREARTNGWYDPSDGSIHLDIAKIENGERSVLFTLSHELVHFIEDWSAVKYETFANFLLKNYAEHGVATDQLVREKMAELNTTDYDYAMSEVVADACERMLLDSNAAQKLAELNKTDKGLAQKIKDFFDNVLKRIRNAYANYKGRTEAQYLQKMDDVLSEFHEMFAEALADAARNYQDADGKLGDSEVREQAKKYPLAKKKKSWYNQYTTVALQWAHSDRTKPGDRKVVYEAGKGYHLIEAMEDGYFEVFTGSYEEVERYDSTYRSSVETFYGNIEALSNDERGNIRNLRYDRNGRHDVGHGESIPGGHDASRSDEHLRSSNQGKSSFIEKDQAKEQRKLNSTREILANVDLKTADLSKRGGDQLAAHLKDYQEKERELKEHEAKVRSLSEKILKMRHDREKGKPYVSSEMDALLTERNRETILASQVRRSMQLITTAPVVKDFVQREKLTAWRQNRDEIERGKMERVRVTEIRKSGFEEQAKKAREITRNVVKLRVEKVERNQYAKRSKPRGLLLW